MDSLPKLLLFVSSHTVLTGPPAPDTVVCQPGYVPSQQEISYPAPPCEPCIEHGVAYPGNNVFLAPNYGVNTVMECRDLCREEIRCHYFTWDTTNLWCYLKSSKSSTSTDRHTRYVSGSENILCQSDDENEIETDTKLSDTLAIEDTNTDTEKDNLVKDTEKDKEMSTPILSVYHNNGYRTVLTAIPATFGLKIQNDTEVSGQLVQVEHFMCNLPPTFLPQTSKVGNQFAVIRRGVCKFAEKVETAVKAGFDGVVILDDQNNTEVKQISGTRTSLTENVPVIFLLKSEATLLKKLLAESPNRTATIQDSSAFSWFGRKTTTSIKPPLTPLEHFQEHRKFLLGMRDPYFWSSRRKEGKFPAPPLLPSKSSTTTTSESPFKEISTEAASPRGMLEMTPLTMGSIIVGVLFFVLLLTSVGTLIVSKITKRAKRRANHTRCQLAIRQMEANGSLSQDNPGFSPDSSTSSPPARSLPKSTYSLLECPVCLELAWPPKRIYQCREGHIVCDVCKANPNLRNCPMCRIPFATNFTSRNRQLEELARALKEEDQLDHITTVSTTTVIIPSAPALSEVADDMVEGDTSELLQSETSEVHSVRTEVHISAEINSAPDQPEQEVRHGVGQAGGVGPLVVNLPPEVGR